MAPADWDGERGGFDDFTMTIEEAKFGFNAALAAVRKADVKQLILTGSVVLGDGSVHLNNDQGFGIGDKFDIVDGGARAIHESGDEGKQFHYQTGFMTMVRAARACGAAEVLADRCNNDPLNLHNAHVWVGLKFRFQRVEPKIITDEDGVIMSTGKIIVNGKEIAEGSFKDRNTGELVVRRPLIPTEYLGEVGGASGDAGSPQASTKNGSGSDDDLIELAKSSDKMDFLDVAVREKGMDISDAEELFDKANA